HHLMSFPPRRIEWPVHVVHVVHLVTLDLLLSYICGPRLLDGLPGRGRELLYFPLEVQVGFLLVRLGNRGQFADGDVSGLCGPFSRRWLVVKGLETGSEPLRACLGALLAVLVLLSVEECVEPFRGEH